jgi:hypothetical protein
MNKTNTLRIGDLALVLTNGIKTAIVTGVPVTLQENDKELQKIAEGLTFKTLFDDGPHVINCHVFPDVNIISYDLLAHEESVISSAIKFRPDKDQ